MRPAKTALVALTSALLLLSHASSVAACGGCLGPPVVQQSEATVVTGHKMILSITKEQTSLWDQITYSGAPKEFAWVLPIKGKVAIGLSSDILFKSLEQRTEVTVQSPVIQCDQPAGCGSQKNAGLASADSGGSFGHTDTEAPPVTVLAEEVVGPYETVQLHSSDAGALEGWLKGHGYVIPENVAPVVAAYVSEGFDFLALRLIPGAGIQSMRPVRITSPGASLALPLRMVAAGTGAVTPITLWVIGEGRYDTANMPSFTVDPKELLWNWDTSSSNYASWKRGRFDASSGKAWLIEAGEPIDVGSIRYPIDEVVQFDPASSGYTSPDKSAADLEEEDLLTLFGGSFDGSRWVTRLHGELSREGLADDLVLWASLDQSVVPRFLRVQAAVGTPPACPPVSTCGGASSPSPFTAWRPGTKTGSASCALAEGADSAVEGSGLALAAALLLARRRRQGARPR